MVLFLREAMRAIASLGCEGVMRAIASSISKHVSSAGPHTDFQCRNRRRRMHCQRPQLVKGKSPQGSRVTVQKDQYLLCSAAPLTSCSSPALTASRLTSSVLPHVSLGASQLLKPASTTPRSYGRRHRSWHHGHVHATHNERRRGQWPVHHDQAPAWRLGHRHGHHGQAPGTHNEFRRGKRPGRNDHPICSAAPFEVYSEPHTGARPLVRLCVGPELARCVHT